MVKETENQLVGRCPICQANSASTDHSDAYVGSTINDSDKDVYLEWSVYYQLMVCRMCKIDGQDLTIDEVRDREDREAETARQKMGFRKTYVPN